MEKTLLVGGFNPVIAAALSAWLIAQTTKVVLSLYHGQAAPLRRMVGSGGMPSSHTALVVAMTTAVGLQEGFNSTLFAISLILTLVVMYDATGVRRAAGKQARVLNRLLYELRVEHTIHDARLKELLGHTPLEVLAGSLVGIATAWFFCRMAI